MCCEEYAKHVLTATQGWCSTSSAEYLSSVSTHSIRLTNSCQKINLIKNFANVEKWQKETFYPYFKTYPDFEKSSRPFIPLNSVAQLLVQILGERYLRIFYMFLESDNPVKLLLDRTRKAFPERTFYVKLESKESSVSLSQRWAGKPSFSTV